MKTPAVPDGFGLDTPLRRAHFMAQLAHESAGFTRLVENLNYSAEALLRTWPSRFTPESAKACARQPEKIANTVYAGRLGNDQPGDGWRYRGRGPLMLTGKANYAHFSERLYGDDRLVRDPHQAAEPVVGMQIAAAYWQEKGLNSLADRDELEAITRRVNGGLIGLESRRKWLQHFKREYGLQ